MLRIRDAQGTVVRELSGDATKDAGKVGVNRVYWDLRHQPLPAPRTPQPGGGGGGGFGGGGLNGPNVLPGEYRVTLLVGGKEVATKTVRVTGDTAVPMTDADRKVWHDTSMSLHEHAARGERHRRRGDHAQRPGAAGRSAVEDGSQPPARGKGRRSRTPRSGLPICAAGWASARPAAEAVAVAVSRTSGQQIGQLKGQVMGSTSLPTAMQIRSTAEAREDLMKAVQDTNDLIAAVPQLYEKLGASGLKPTALTAIAMK